LLYIVVGIDVGVLVGGVPGRAGAVGVDVLQVRCQGCGHEVMQPRRKVEKMIKRIIPKEELE